MIGKQAGLAILACALMGAAGCTTVAATAVTDAGHSIAKAVTPTNVQTKAVLSIRTVQAGRIAVMPLVDNPPQGAEPLAPGAADAITAELYSQATLLGGWQVIPESDVMQALQKLPPTTPRDLDQNALQVGRLVSVDGVLYGMVERYKERVGLDYSAASPAAVTFSLRFVDMKSGQIVWQAKFAKSQKALSENIFNLANFVQHSGRWVRANEIAQEGVKAALGDLHGRLDLAKNVKRFETGTYGELKSGGQRYNSGANGNFGQGD